MKCRCYIDSPIGRLCMEEEQGAITKLYVVGDEACETAFTATDGEPKTQLLELAASQLTEYFAGKRKAFDLPIRPQGTEFQRKVWQALCRIPYGEIRSYGEIALQIGNPKACRAVGGANHKNPILILIPCHRVVGAGGDLTGFACGLETKEYLLKLEKVID